MPHALFYWIPMADFIEALKRPFSNLKALLVGTCLGALPLLNLLLLGFGLGEVEKELNINHKQVKWWHMNRILYNTTAAIAVIVFYFSPVILGAIFFLGPVVVRFIGIMQETMIVQLALLGTSPFELGSLSLIVGKKLTKLLMNNIPLVAPIALVALLFYYLLPFALIGFVRDQQIRSAFDWRVVREAFTLKYLFYWLLFHFYLFTLFIVLSLLFFLPFLNFLLVGFMLFIGVSTGFNLFSQVFLES